MADASVVSWTRRGVVSEGEVVLFLLQEVQPQQRVEAVQTCEQVVDLVGLYSRCSAWASATCVPIRSANRWISAWVLLMVAVASPLPSGRASAG